MSDWMETTDETAKLDDLRARVTRQRESIANLHASLAQARAETANARCYWHEATREANAWKARVEELEDKLADWEDVAREAWVAANANTREEGATFEPDDLWYLLDQLIEANARQAARVEELERERAEHVSEMRSLRARLKDVHDQVACARRLAALFEAHPSATAAAMLSAWRDGEKQRREEGA